MEDWDGRVICLGNKVNAVRSRQTPLKESNTRYVQHIQYITHITQIADVVSHVSPSESTTP